MNRFIYLMVLIAISASWFLIGYNAASSQYWNIEKYDLQVTKIKGQAYFIQKWDDKNYYMALAKATNGQEILHSTYSWGKEEK